MTHNNNPMKLVAFICLGCSKNLVDGEKMLASLAEAGMVVGAPMEEADVIVINTCGFINSAREESHDFIAQALEIKSRREGVRVVVAGCLPSRDGEDIYQRANGVDAIVGVNDRDAIVDAVLAKSEITLLSDYTQTKPAVSDSGRFRLTDSHIAYLRIAEGCSQKCSFCTIPVIRGPFRSKSADVIYAEASELIADGALELGIIAQDTTAYGSDTGDITLAKLLRRLDSIDGAKWLRLMYTYPSRFTSELIETIATCQHVLPYVDIPIQHISDSVLSRMGRQINGDDIRSLLDNLRQAIPSIAIRTTLMVGFPGETQENFDELLRFVQQQRFDALGVFEFSPEPPAPAAFMPNQISDDIKTQRAEIIMLAQQDICFDANEKAIGSKLTVLVDGVDSEGRCFGRTQHQAPDVDSICYLTDHVEPGQFINTTVIASDEYDLIVKPKGTLKN